MKLMFVQDIVSTSTWQKRKISVLPLVRSPVHE